MSNTVNYQLYRTNTILGGQMKWDLVVKNTGGKLVVDDFHLTPVSKGIPCIKNSVDTNLNYPHQYNVQKFYHSIEGNFYSNYIRPEFQHKWPIIDNGSYTDTHDGSLESGCSRAQYSLYGKQFEFLVPLWLEDLEGKDIKFKIRIRSASQSSTDSISPKTLSMKTLSIGLPDNSNPVNTFHGKFERYFDDYVRYIGLRGDKYAGSIEGSDILNIDVNRSQARIVGLNVANGNVESKSVDSLAYDLLSRERPLMEFDNRIIQEFVYNKLITRQLFNFNLCFNIDDVVSRSISDQLTGKNLRVSVDVIVGDNQLQKMDFFTNYEYISKDASIIDHSSQNNVLSYLKDDQCEEFMYANKFSPNILHWSLTGQNEYVFNLYDGFGGVYEGETGELLPVHRQMGSTPNLMSRKYSKEQNNINWCYRYIGTGDNDGKMEPSDYPKFILGLREQVEKASVFTPGSENWVYNINYKKSTPIENDIKVIRVITMVVNDALWSQLSEGAVQIQNTDHASQEDNLMWVQKSIDDDVVNLIVGKTMNSITFKNVTALLMMNTWSSSTGPYTYINEFKNILSRVNEPRTFAFTKGLYISKADAPSLGTNEIEYYKNDDMNIVYVTRYDGSIRPTFLTGGSDSRYFNNVHTKKMLKKGDIVVSNDDREKNSFSKFASSGFEPSFKSIGYYSIISKQYNYKDPSDIFQNDVPEYKWFNNGKMLNLAQSISFVTEKTDSLENIVKSKIQEYYGIEDGSKLIDYIFDLYDIHNDYNCELDEEKTDLKYTYNITLILK